MKVQSLRLAEVDFQDSLDTQEKQQRIQWAVQ